MSEHVILVQDATFEQEVIKSNIPVVVDFWVEWCGPCRMLAPILEAIADEYAGKVKFVKANIDENSDMSEKYNVRGIPAILLFKDGEVLATKIGALTKTEFRAFIDTHLNGDKSGE